MDAFGRARWLLAVGGAFAIYVAFGAYGGYWALELHELRRWVMIRDASNPWVIMAEHGRGPVWPFLLHQWTALFGFERWVARLPSAVAMLAGAAAFVRLLPPRIPERKRFELFVLIVLSPYAIDQAREVRSYAFIMALGLIYTALVWRTTESPRMATSGAALALAWLLTTMHLTTATLQLAWPLALMLRGGRRARAHLLTIVALAGLGYGVWLTLLSEGVRPSREHPLDIDAFVHPFLVPTGLYIVPLLAMVAIAFVWRRIRPASPQPMAPGDTDESLGLGATLAVTWGLMLASFAAAAVLGILTNPPSHFVVLTGVGILTVSEIADRTARQLPQLKWLLAMPFVYTVVLSIQSPEHCAVVTPRKRQSFHDAALTAQAHLERYPGLLTAGRSPTVVFPGYMAEHVQYSTLIGVDPFPGAVESVDVLAGPEAAGDGCAMTFLNENPGSEQDDPLWSGRWRAGLRREGACLLTPLDALAPGLAQFGPNVEICCPRRRGDTSAQRFIRIQKDQTGLNR
jgi:hypothetical protein